MRTLSPILNREGQAPTDNWFHIVPLGEYQHTGDDKKKRIQVLDKDAIAKMANSFKPKLLVDQDHFSYDPDKPSVAYGWLEEVQARDNGLWGRIEWTDLGDNAIKNRQYRFLSPVWLPRDLEQLGNDRVRPTRLDTIGLTNSPNLKGMVPLKNRDDASASAAGQTKNKGNSKMKTIAVKLGLSAEASEDAIVEQITKLENRAKEAEAKLPGLEADNKALKNRVAEQDNEQIEQEFEARKVEEKTRAKLRPVLTTMKNREERIEFLNDVIGEPEETDSEVKTKSGNAVLNRERAGTPNPRRASGKESDEDLARKQSDAVQDYRMKNRCSWDQAYGAVMRSRPELFGAE